MVLVKDKTLVPARPGKKPTRFRFKGNIRLGFKGKEIVEITKFKNVRKK